MRAADGITDTSYVQVSETCLLKLCKDALKIPGMSSGVPDMRFTVLRRAKVRSTCLLMHSYNVHDLSREWSTQAIAETLGLRHNKWLLSFFEDTLPGITAGRLSISIRGLHEFQQLTDISSNVSFAGSAKA